MVFASFFGDLGEIVKIENRFLIVMTSIVAGCLGGWWYFEEGNAFCDPEKAGTSESFFEVAEDADSMEALPETLSETKRSSSRNLPYLNSRVCANDSVRASKNRTLYEIAAASLDAADPQVAITQKKSENLLADAPAPKMNSAVQPCRGLPEPEAALEVLAKSSNELARSLDELARSVPALKKNPASEGPNHSVSVEAEKVPAWAVASADANSPSHISADAQSCALAEMTGGTALFRVSEFQKDVAAADDSLSAVALLTPRKDVPFAQRMAGLKQLAEPESASETEAAPVPNAVAEAAIGKPSGEVPVSPGAETEIDFQVVSGVKTATGGSAAAGVTAAAGVPTAARLTDAERVASAAVPVSALGAFPELGGDLERSETEGAIGSRADLPANPFMGAEKAALDREGTAAALALAGLPETPDWNSAEKELAENSPTSENAVTEDGQNAEPADVKAGPIRMKKPVRNAERQETERQEATASAFGTEIPEAPARKYVLSVRKENVRKALATFQRETGLKVVASLDVQGEVTCEAQSEDPETLLSQLLADTQFRFVRSGKFVYVAHSSALKDLPEPLEKTETRVFVPENVSLEELELVLGSNLTQFGECERTREAAGREALKVTDWVLALNQLDGIQRLVDLPEPENRIAAFVFQHELNGAPQPLNLTEIAENRGLVLQRMPIPGAAEPKKSLFGKKKESVPDLLAYSISFRADTFMIGVKDQLGVETAAMPALTEAAMVLNQPLDFDFNLKVDENSIPYHVTLTFRENPKAGQEGESPILAEVVCQPKEDLGPKSKPRPIQLTLPMPLQGGNALVFQFNLGEFAHQETDLRKNPAYVLGGNRVKKEVVIVFNPFQQMPKLPESTFTAAAVREIIHQQEVLGRKYYGSLDRSERDCSALCFGLAQRLKQGMEVR